MWIEITQMQKGSQARSSADTFWENRWWRNIDPFVAPLSRALPIVADTCSVVCAEGNDDKVDCTLDEEEGEKVSAMAKVFTSWSCRVSRRSPLIGYLFLWKFREQWWEKVTISYFWWSTIKWHLSTTNPQGKQGPPPPPELPRIQLKVQVNQQLLSNSLRTFSNISK